MCVYRQAILYNQIKIFTINYNKQETRKYFVSGKIMTDSYNCPQICAEAYECIS